jgi:hypothetical protein
LSLLAGYHGSDSHGMMISHGFAKKMRFLGHGEDVDHLFHKHGMTQLPFPWPNFGPQLLS